MDYKQIIYMTDYQAQYGQGASILTYFGRNNNPRLEAFVQSYKMTDICVLD